MKMTGQILHENREKKGISISEVALATKIHSKIIEAIEHGNTDKLPSKAFLRGFVQSYATYLKLEMDTILNVFNEEMGSTRPKAKTAVEPDVKNPKTLGASGKSADELVSSNEHSFLVRSSLIGAVLVLAVVIIWMGRALKNRSTESSVTVEEPSLPNQAVEGGAAALEEAPMRLGASISGSESTPPGGGPSSLAIQQPMLGASPSPTTATAPNLGAGSNVTALPAATTKAPTTTLGAAALAPLATTTSVPPSGLGAPPVGPTALQAPKPTVDPVVASTPKAFDSHIVSSEERVKVPMATKPEGSALRSQEIIVEALDTIEINYSIDGAPVKNRKLKPDQIQVLKAQDKLSLEVSNGGAVSLIHNGRDIGVPGTLGASIRLTFPR